MKKTKEQQLICDKSLELDRMKIDAGAGSGKTSVLSMIAEGLKEESLLLVFNKSAQEDASSRFPSHVKVQTTHSLAYRAVGHAYQSKLSRPKGAYVNVADTVPEITRFYKIKDMDNGDKGVIKKNQISLLIKSTVNKFESSHFDEVNKDCLPWSLLNDLYKKNPKADMETLKALVLKTATLLWNDRTDLTSPVKASHDTYMKLFQLSKPNLPFDVIYLDEAQDTTDCVLDIVLNQDHAKLFIVGDDRQAIYGWRGAVNALEKVDFPTFKLTKSFRFGEEVADVATKVLEGQKEIVGYEELDSVAGESVVDFDEPHTILYRTNSALLMDAVKAILQGQEVALEVDVRGFCNKLDSAFQLFTGNVHKVKHEDIIPYASWSELKEDAEDIGEIARIANIIENKQYNRIVNALNDHVNSRNPHVTFTTAHKSKGREWDQVVLASDFPSHLDSDGAWRGLSTEEQNLLYVACTRAQKKLELNSSVMEIFMKDLLIRDQFREKLAEETDFGFYLPNTTY